MLGLNDLMNFHFTINIVKKHGECQKISKMPHVFLNQSYYNLYLRLLH